MRLIKWLLFALLLSTLLVWSNGATAQISEGGLPPSFAYPSLVKHAKESVSINIDFDIEKLKEEDRERESNNLPLRTAIIIPSDLSIDNAGEWTNLPNGQTIWRLDINAPKAIAIMLYYDEFYIPKGGKLFIYNANKTHVLGAYTEKTNPNGKAFATEFVAGDKITLEYVAPEAIETLEGRIEIEKDKPRIKLSGIGYGYNYLDVYEYKNIPENNAHIGRSGWCMININCPEGDNWQHHKKGIAKSLTPIGNSTWLCSGTLVNNTAQDLSPYFLTASHCFYNGSTKCSEWEKIIYYIQFESPTCTPTNPPINSFTMVGAELLVDVPIKGGSDGGLLKLLNNIPDNYNVFYNGWDRRNIPAESGVGIHHPAGDLKKISTYITPLTTTTWNGQDKGAPDAHWNVVWAKTVSGKSLTEGGSSGSPLFNQDQRIVGTLTGGPSQAGVPKCDQPVSTHVAIYGKFWYHWDKANVVHPTKRMKDYLDPINSGAEYIDGTYTKNNEPIAFFTANPNEIYVFNSIKFINSSYNAQTYEWTFEGGTPSSFNQKDPPLITYSDPGTFEAKLIINKGTENEKQSSLNVTVKEKGDNPVPPKAIASLNRYSGGFLINEGFDNEFPPQDWTLEKPGESPKQFIQANMSNENYNFYKIDPKSKYSALVEYDNTKTVDTWLKTKIITIPDNSILDFYAFYNSSYIAGGTLYVHITVDGTNWDTLWTNGPENGTDNTFKWYKQTVKLNDYAGKTIQLGFRYHGKGGHIGGFDGIKLYTPSEPNIPITVEVGDYIYPIDLSTGPPILYNWTFDGGEPNISTKEEPVIRYMNPGNYDVSLKVKNYRGEDEVKIVKGVNVEAKKPAVDFKIEGGYTKFSNYAQFIPKGSKLNFIDKSNKYPTSWEWKFDGATPSTSNEANPKDILYSNEGEFDFSFIAKNSAGADTIARSKYIDVGFKTNKIWNLDFNEKANSVYTYSNGYVTGVNTADYDMFAESFDAPLVESVITSINVLFHVKTIGKGDLTLSIRKNNKGVPGSTIASLKFPSTAIDSTGGYTTLSFPEPVTINEAFFVVLHYFDGYGGTTYDLAIKSTMPRENGKNTAYAYNYMNIFYGLPGWQAFDKIFNDFAISLNIVPEITYVNFEGLVGEKKFNKKNIDTTTQSINVLSNIPWTATTDANWIIINNGANTQNGTFSFNVKNNNYNARKGLIKLSAAGGKYEDYILVQQAGPNPSELMATVANEAKGEIELNWSLPIIKKEYVLGSNIFEDVEEHDSFTLDSSGEFGWSFIDGDKGITFKIGSANYPNWGKQCSFIVFNPSNTSPVTTSAVFKPHSGKQFFGCAANLKKVQNNDWIISPQLKFKGDFKLSFWAKSAISTFGLERMRVAYSETGKEEKDFTNVLTAGNYVEVPITWTNYEYTIPANAKYVAVNCVSNDAFMFLLDDIFIGIGEVPQSAYEANNAFIDNNTMFNKYSNEDENILPDKASVYSPTEIQNIIQTHKKEANNPIGLTDETTGETIIITPKIDSNSENVKNKDITIGAIKTYNNDSKEMQKEEVKSTSSTLPLAKLRYDDGKNNSAIGMDNKDTTHLEIAIRFDQRDLLKYHKAKMKAIDIFTSDVPLNNNFIINIRQGDNIIHSQEAILSAMKYTRVQLMKELTIDASQELIVGYEYKQTGEKYIAGCDKGPGTPGKSDLIAINGQNFTSLYNLNANLNYNWNIVLLVEDNSGIVDLSYKIYRDSLSVITTRDTSAIDKIITKKACYEVTSIYNGELESTPSNSSCILLAQVPKPDAITDLVATVEKDTIINLNWTKSLDAVSYKIYRDDIDLEIEVTDTLHTDISLAPAKYCYHVTVINSVGTESENSNIACATIEELSVDGVIVVPTSIELLVGNTEQLTATISPSNAKNQNLKWTTSNSRVATVDNNGLVKAIGYGDATITVTTEENSFTATCKVKVYTTDKGYLKVSEGFTPNGDGINDYFIIEHIEDHPENELTVFDRSGSTQYSTTSYKNNWDGVANNGKYNGQKVPAGSYYYILKVKGRDEVKGFVVIRY